MRWAKVNVNPKGRKTGDCYIRAISQALNCSWEEALTRAYTASMETKFDPSSKEVMNRVLGQEGFVKWGKPFKENGKTYKVKEADMLSSRNAHFIIVCEVANHYVVVKDKTYIDTWDSGNKSIYMYWYKECSEKEAEVYGKEEAVRFEL